MRNRSELLTLRFFLPLVILIFFIYWKRVFWDNMLPCDGDTLRLVYPSWMVVRNQLRHFQSLLWDPLRNMGQPLLASPPAEVLYPLQWISPFMGFVSYSKIFIAFHTALVLFYGYKLFAMLHQDEWTGWFGAIALAFNGLMINKASVHCDLAAMSWIPACFYFLCRRRPLPLGVCLAFQWLAGLPTYSILTGVMMGAYAVSSDMRAKYFRVLFQSGAIGAGLSAIQWVPFLECLHESQRGVLLTKDVATQFSLSPIELLRGLALPSAITSARPPASASDPAVTGYFIGPLLSVLFIGGAWRSTKTIRWMSVFTLLAFVLTLGDHLKFYARIPFITVFRFPALWLVPATFGLIWVGCACFHSIRSGGVRRWVLFAVIVDLLVYSFTPLAGYADAVFMTATPLRPQRLLNIPQGTRLFHTWNITDTVHRWQFRRMEDWYIFKGMLVPSIGVAYGIPEVASRSQLISRRHGAFLMRLNQAATGSPLFAEARISRVVTLIPDAVMKTMPDKNDVRVMENIDLKPRAWMNNGNPVEIERDAPGLLACTTTGPGKLIWSESFFPGWTASSDGQAIATRPFDETFLSVDVPKGKHAVVLKYRPVSFYIGAAMTAVTLALIALFSVV